MSIYLGNKLLGGTSHDTVSNAHSLLDYKWSDHILNEMSWLRADTWSWQSGDVYTAAYNHLKADIANSELKIENINGVTIAYYLAKDKHKICPFSEIQRLTQIYTNAGMDWFYLIDQTNRRFKLPKALHSEIIERYQNGDNWYRIYADGWCEQGGTVSIAYNASTTENTLLIPFTDAHYLVNLSMGGFVASGVASVSWQSKTTTAFTIYGDYSASGGTGTFSTNWEAKGYISKDSITNIPKYLYFYVGEYSTNAIEQTAGITSEELNDKIDTDLSNATDTTKHTIVTWNMPDLDNGTYYTNSAPSEFTAPYNCYCVMSGATLSYDLYKPDGTTLIIAEYGYSANYTKVHFLLKKGYVLKRTTISTYNIFSYYPLIGGESSA